MPNSRDLHKQWDKGKKCGLKQGQHPGAAKRKRARKAAALDQGSDFKMPFGKFRGKSLAEIDISYLSFLLCQPFLNGPTRSAIAAHVRRHYDLMEQPAPALERGPISVDKIRPPWE